MCSKSGLLRVETGLSSPKDHSYKARGTLGDEGEEAPALNATVPPEYTAKLKAAVGFRLLLVTVTWICPVYLIGTLEPPPTSWSCKEVSCTKRVAVASVAMRCVVCV